MRLRGAIAVVVVAVYNVALGIVLYQLLKAAANLIGAS